MIGYIFLIAKTGILKITLNCISLLVLQGMYTFVSVILVRLENVPGFPQCFTLVRAVVSLFSLWSDLLSGDFLGAKLTWEFQWTNNSFEIETDREDSAEVKIYFNSLFQ